MTFSMTTADATQVPVWVTQAARTRAERFAEQQPTPHQATQVYQNTLAVCVVNDYLKLFGIQTQVDASDSWHPVLRLANPVADLAIAGYGRVECCSVTAADTACAVPLEAQGDRIAYIVVRFETNSEATLLGFAKMVENESTPLSALRPMAEFSGYLAQLMPVVDLRLWLEGIYQQDWCPAEALLHPKQLALTHAATVQRAKQIALNLESAHRDAILLLSVTSQQESLSVRAQLHPAIVADQAVSGTRLIHSTLDCLAPNITFAIYTAAGSLAKAAMSRTFPRDNCIQLPSFQGQWGEQFTLRISTGDDSQIDLHFRL